MNPRTSVALTAIAVALLFGGLWLRDRDARLRTEGRLELLQVELDSARVQSDRQVAAADDAARQAGRVMAQERIAREAAQRDAAAARARQSPDADSIVLIAATGDTAAVRARVDTLLADFEAERSGLLAVIRSDSLVIIELRALAGARLDAMTALEGRALAAEAVAGAALGSRPGWWERTGWKLAVPLALAAGWELRSRLYPVPPVDDPHVTPSPQG